ncbi:NAD(P)-dependent alcohol dehydrogenase [Corallococcus sp. bb12-1]|uniref:NAD(P)-dependent alcohol dehydrogenase n=1 Tax=Corallococcus sp. bb12-1 TaxID=2996784 RepID=UPI00226E359B|nr:NAD(P)-dependent alcohol dehydrogenase [Corallococcus sp. bb12-1]MCY1042202.1 NAD(P)-dependent alcohol dehydrogenase [Corallococcus sp. bb12-1]
MPTTHAYSASSAKAALGPFTLERREPRPQDVLIDIQYCGVCHSDIHQARDEWGGAIFPMVPGHEIVGKVSQVGSAVTDFKVGDSVGVGCFVDSCRECPPCLQGDEQYCERGMVSTYNGRQRDGTPTYGGYSTRITVDSKYVLRIPEGIPLERAAPLLCAGITTYSPLRHYGLKPGGKLAVVGLGGLGHMGVKLGKAMGAEVTVLSTSPSKRDDALALGATHFAATSDKKTFKALANQFDLILDTVSAPHDYNAYLGLLKLDGTMILVGVPEAPTPLAAFPLVMKRRKLGGSLIGGIRETQEMLDFCAKHQVASDVEVIPIQKINEAYERMIKGDVRYRFVIDIASLKQA